MSTVQSFNSIVSLVDSIKGMSDEMIHRKCAVNAALHQTRHIPSAFESFVDGTQINET